MARRDNVADAPLPGGGSLLVSSEFRRARRRPRRILSPLQSEFAWSLRLFDPRRRELDRCELRSWTGEFDAVFPAPDGSVAAVRWNDQTEAGLVLVGLEEGLRQLDAAWDTRRTNWLEGPVWTPDSRLLVLTENPPGASPWWAEDED